MKKIKLQMLGLSVNDLLSREQMKKVVGGSGGGSGGSGIPVCSGNACTLYVQNKDGSYTPYNGTCQATGWWPAQSCYCSTQLGNVPVTSNGGHSRCS